MNRHFFIIISFIFFVLNAPMHTMAIELSEAEQAWLKQNHTVRISGPQSFPPFQYVDEKGHYNGIAAEYVIHIAKLVGLNIKFMPKQTWPEILTKTKEKEIDVLSCAAITPERQTYLNFAKPHLSFPLVIISKKDGPFIQGIESLHKKKIAFIKGNVTHELVSKEQIQFEAEFVQSPLEALKAVSNGTAIATIENLATASFLIEKYGLTNLMVAAPTSYESYGLAIGVRDDWPELVSIINKALASISQEKHNEIRQRWIFVRYEHGLNFLDLIKWAALVSTVALLIITGFIVWNRRLSKEISERKKIEKEKENLIENLTTALDEIKTLRGILPICSECKKIRDDKGYWTRLESYISHHSEADFSHGLCPHCIKDLYGKEEWFTSANTNTDK